jgi:hypothetical protein
MVVYLVSGAPPPPFPPAEQGKTFLKYFIRLLLN